MTEYAPTPRERLLVRVFAWTWRLGPIPVIAAIWWQRGWPIGVVAAVLMSVWVALMELSIGRALRQ
jgi:hypothetical protein